MENVLTPLGEEMSKKKKVTIILSIIVAILIIGEGIQLGFYWSDKQEKAKAQTETAKRNQWISCINESLKTSKNTEEFLGGNDDCWKKTR